MNIFESSIICADAYFSVLYFETSAAMAIAEFLMNLAMAHQRTLLKFDTFLLSLLKSEFVFDRKRN
jgi:hypothetical protein